ncbi:interleukin-6 receptor subunit alpha [Syngnathoides biaculeatus]|uniref:interleukin-6 receptor subunit alpha n=1 Tax=Syngnathoides biaculeatus TaxID=300417 RepID=UPI002ADD563F|nr:interleukin-6 receptor subunit alpha [Syngnathoides biaculeatus]
MHVFPTLLWFLCATPVCGIFLGTCLRKGSPGVLVLSPGSSLVMSCEGDVMVDGAKVTVAKQPSNDKDSSSETQTSNGAFIKTDRNTLTDKSQEEGVQSAVSLSSSTSSSFPTHQELWATSTHLKGEDMDGSKWRRGTKGKPKWKWKGRTVGRGRWDWDGFVLGESGTQLSVTSARLKDSGNYTCQHRGREMFSLKVVVADPPEVPHLSCSKKSPSSKIRCDWTPQKPLTLRPSCYLLVNKRPSDRFHRVECSFSSQWSRCWCVLEHNEDERRIRHMAYLCVTNMAGNATSTILTFSPLGILKPDPPSAVSVQQKVGEETRMVVNWTFPTSWKSQDSYYELKYELKYQPVGSSPSSTQLMSISGRRSFTITDAMPGVMYVIQLRTQDEYDGLWSSWSAPVYGSSWIDTRTQEPTTLLNDDLLNITFPEYDGSGTDDLSDALPESTVGPGAVVSHHILWISCSLAIVAVILAVYIFRHKEKFMTKLHSLSFRRHYKGPAKSNPPTPTAPESRALVTFNPPRPKEEPPVGEEEEAAEENHGESERREAIHFNNTNYFFMQRE